MRYQKILFLCAEETKDRDKKTKRTMAGPASSIEKCVHLTIPSLSGFDFWYLPASPYSSWRETQTAIHTSTRAVSSQ